MPNDHEVKAVILPSDAILPKHDQLFSRVNDFFSSINKQSNTSQSGLSEELVNEIDQHFRFRLPQWTDRFSDEPGSPDDISRTPLAAIYLKKIKAEGNEYFLNKFFTAEHQPEFEFNEVRDYQEYVWTLIKSVCQFYCKSINKEININILKKAIPIFKKIIILISYTPQYSFHYLH